ncbi:MAG: anhydro-N-acetylmuramic acid kinase [Candidatus Paracaedibacteraceae bacterium]|nr:anhydro-N-acetylmuramic acid kinase [Candidatus Paracaedibacteraceae bacterium]
MEPIWAMGLMSGTSLDGVDAALILTDGITVYDTAESIYIPYPSNFQDRLRSVLGKETASPSLIQESTQFHIQAIRELLYETKHKVELIGYHGQTIYHAPPKTVQIGNAQTIFDEVNVPVVYDFRTQDCLNDGQGAPLVPIFHKALVQNLHEPTVVINIGGVANLTYIDDDTLIAGDIGPGNALINDVMVRDFAKPYDENGVLAAANPVNQSALDLWLRDPYFDRIFPKSLDRDHFSSFKNVLSGGEAVATLTELTIQSILNSFSRLPKKPKYVYLCGGGAKNQTIASGLMPCITLKDSDMIEAQAFAYLAVRVLRGLPTSFPTTTGCTAPTCGGKITSPLEGGAGHSS